ncbi:MAG: hypothetical protein CSA40_00350 [Flavobacteriales bacterium]|nr:MAG: hypothetical protein CSA40_00350 [Flavobacteriales bacterium]
MDSFLKRLIGTIFKTHSDTENLSIILPNQRAGVYLKHHLKQQYTQGQFLPHIYTFDSFIEHIANAKKTPKIELLFLLYQAYQETTPATTKESFDRFVNWGATVLEDFNTLDLYLSPVDTVLEQLKHINKIHNWTPNTTLSHNYLLFLQNLTPLYHRFIDLLKSTNKNYQGLLYREAVEQINIFTNYTTGNFIFAGFNAFTPAQWFIVQELINQDKAQLYWNLPTRYDFLYRQYTFIKNIQKEQWNVGQHYTNDAANQTATINIISAGRASSSMKYTASLLKNAVNTNNTALIPLKQDQVASILESIPETVKSMNITMGLPLKMFQSYSLIQRFFQLNINARQQNSKYYYRDLITLTEHPLITLYSQASQEWKKAIISKQKLYLTQEDLDNINQTIQSPFNILLEGLKCVNTQDYLKLLNRFFNHLKQKTSETEREALFHIFTINNLFVSWMDTYQTDFSLKTFYTLYHQLISQEQINFMGEPLEGLQIMGFLELQSLAFDHVILCQANEGYLPSEDKKPSYIPYDLRLQHGLPTHEVKQGMEAMILAHVLNQSSKVTILYNTDTGTFGSNELSRFVQQLLWKNLPVSSYNLSDHLDSHSILPLEIAKTKTIYQSLKQWMQKGISPSALGTYTYNPIDFYNKYILGINPQDDIQETIGEQLLGTVVHNTLQDLYTPFINTNLTSDALRQASETIDTIVEDHFYSNFESSRVYQGMNYLIVYIAKHFIKRFIKQEIQSLEKGHRIKILHLEKVLKTEYISDTLPFNITFKGIVDRVDIFDNTLRIIDYKTGMVQPSQLNISNFNEKLLDYKYAKAIQIIIYAYLYLNNHNLADIQTVNAGIISFKNHSAGFMPLNRNTHRNPETELSISTIKNLMNSIEHIIIDILSVENNFTEKAT